MRDTKFTKRTFVFEPDHAMGSMIHDGLIYFHYLEAPKTIIMPLREQIRDWEMKVLGDDFLRMRRKI